MTKKPMLDLSDQPIYECPYCGDRYGRRLEEDWDFCPDCGERIDWKELRGEIWYGDPDAYKFHKELERE